MVWDQRDPDKPATEISYPPYSPTPSELEAHRGKAARIEAWSQALPDPHQGSGRSVGAHSAHWSDRPSASTSTLREQPGRQRPNGAGRGYQHPFAAAGAGAGARPNGPPNGQLEIHRRPSRGGPVAPLLARSPFERDTGADYELPRADHLITHGTAQATGQGSMRSQREAYFTAALDLPLDMLTEWDADMVQPFQDPGPEKERDREIERRGTLRSLLGRSKSQVALKPAPLAPLPAQPAPQPGQPSERAVRGFSLDPATAAGAAGTLSKMRSMDAKLLQRASMNGAVPSDTPADGGPEGRGLSSSRIVPGPRPPPSAMRRSPTSNAGPAQTGQADPVVQLTRRTSSRGALAQSTKVTAHTRPQSRTPSPQNSADPPAAHPGAATAPSGVLKDDNGPRANGNAVEELASLPHRKQQKPPATNTASEAARAPASKIPPASAAPVKPSDPSQKRAKTKAPKLPALVVTTPPDEGSKRVKASVAKNAAKENAPNPGLPKRTSSISRTAKAAKPATPSQRTPAQAPATAQPPSPSHPSAAPNPAPSKEKKRPAEPAAVEASQPPSAASKRQSKSRVFSWLPSRNKATAAQQDDQRPSKSQPLAAPAISSSQQQDGLGRSKSQSRTHAQPPPPQQQPPQLPQRGNAIPSQPKPEHVLHGQSQQPSNLSHHQPAPPSAPTLGSADNGTHYGPGPESHTRHAETPMHPHEQQHYTPPLLPPIPQSSGRSPIYEQQLPPQPGPAPTHHGGQWQQQHHQQSAGGGMGANATGMGAGPSGHQQQQQSQHGYQPGHGFQPDPYAHAGHPPHELPNHPQMTMPSSMAHTHYPPDVSTPFTAGRLPSPEAIPPPRRQWFNGVHLFGNQNVPPPPPPAGVDPGVGVDERQKRMSTSADNTNLKKQVSSTSPRSEDSAAEPPSTTLGYRTDATSIGGSMSSVRGNISHSASLEEAAMAHQSKPSLDMSKLQDRLDTGSSNHKVMSPISPLDPVGLSAAISPAALVQDPAPSQTEPPDTPPRTQGAGAITLGPGFTPLKTGWDGSTSGGGAEPRKTSAGTGDSEESASPPKSAGPRTGGSETRTSASAAQPAPSDGAGATRSGSAETKPASSANSGSSASATTGFELSGKSWTESETSANARHASVPSVSEPLAGIELSAPTDSSASIALPEVPELGPDWMLEPLAPEEQLTYLHDKGTVWLHHCGTLRVLERVDEEAEPESRPVSAAAPPLGLGLDLGEVSATPRCGAGGASGRASSAPASAPGSSMAFSRDSLPDMDEYLVRIAARVEEQRRALSADRARRRAEAAAEAGAAAEAEEEADGRKVPGDDGGSGSSSAAKTGAAHSALSAPPRHVVVIRAAAGASGAAAATTPRS